MAKKTYIKVRRGILEPKHIDKLGSAWYLYFYMLDQTDWESGIITDWKDKWAADDLSKPIALIREHRKRLQDEGYINCEQGQHKQRIVIHNWSDPRKNYGIENTEPSEEPEVEGTGHGSGHGIAHGTGHGSGHGFKNQPKKSVLPFNQISNNQIPNTIKESGAKTDTARYSIQSIKQLTGRYPPKEIHERLVSVLGIPDQDKLKECYEEWVSRGFNPQNFAWALEWYPDGIPRTKVKKEDEDPARYLKGKYAEYLNV